MNLIPAEKGGDDYYLNGGYVRLEDAGKDVGDTPEPEKEPQEEQEEQQEPDKTTNRRRR